MQKGTHYLKCSYQLLLAVWFCLAIYFPLTISAQTDTTKKIREVTVTGASMPQIQTIIPSQQISASDFSRYNAFNVADAIRDFAGVILKDYGGIGGLKTVSVRGLSANHTAVLYDGLQINDAENGQVDLSKLNLNNVQQITLYNGQPPVICMPARSFASASILSVKTVQPSLSTSKPFQITAGIKTGSFGLVNPYLQWQQRINNNWAFVINSYLENADGRYKFKTGGGDSSSTRNNSDINAKQADGALYWTKIDSNKFNLHVNYYNSDRGLPGAVILYNPSVSRSRLWNRDFFSQAGYEHIWANSLHLLLNTKVSETNLRYLDPDYLNQEGKLDQRFTQHEFYESAALAYHIILNWDVSYAIDFAINNLDANLSNFSHPKRLTFLNVLASNLSIGKLRLQGSLLNTHITETVKAGTPAPQRNIYSPTLMATVQPFENPNFQLRAFYKSIFRNPTFDDLYYGGIGNPNLTPEFTKQFDLGTTYSKALNGFINYIAFTADAYYNHVDNKIVFIPKDAYNGSIQNFGKADIKGVDASLKTRAKLTTDWKASVSVNYSYQQALNVTDPASSIYLNQLPYTPKNTVSLNAGIDHDHLGVYYNQVISSSRYYTNDNLPYDYISGYSTSDASVVYRFLVKGKPLIASFEANNLFDKSYFVVQSYPMPGRSFRFSFQITI
ncbi:TonB-dependent receptor plug domain-containing protein [Mucilaginibacter aquaedulcis]|uniref:TonB-dependent receptor plug domain-containing protein n=1 Tax=Mucilaginibacter aquaedulcis TaxID=1187081 RepID=UPI0025B43DE6|nr:TonB-dependent receptor [Mucilaginibacter aquaedulcis]MDN3548067.1 TonB-dependent receptor [Mucilaginibacter aquaedulcis]